MRTFSSRVFHFVISDSARERQSSGMLMATGGGKRPRRRLPLADLTNLSSSASRFTLLKAPAQSKSSTSTSIGSSTRSRCPPPPPPPAAEIKGKDKSTRELQSSNCQLKKIKKISKPKVKTGDTLPGALSPPSKKTRKTTKEQQHWEPLDHKFGDSLPTQNFIEKQRAYFAEIDAFELVEEFVSGSDLE